jgi:hypothetical protein
MALGGFTALCGGAGWLHGVGRLHGSVWRRWADPSAMVRCWLFTIFDMSLTLMGWLGQTGPVH